MKTPLNRHTPFGIPGRGSKSIGCVVERLERERGFEPPPSPAQTNPRLRRLPPGGHAPSRLRFAPVTPRKGHTPFENPGRKFKSLGCVVGKLERERGFEPPTLALARRCSTTELFPLSGRTLDFDSSSRMLPCQENRMRTCTGLSVGDSAWFIRDGTGAVSCNRNIHLSSSCDTVCRT